MNSAIKEIAAHAAHCCVERGCKYGDADCPVVLRLVGQLYPCEECNSCKEVENRDIPYWILVTAAGEFKKQTHDVRSFPLLMNELADDPERTAMLWADAERRKKSFHSSNALTQELSETTRKMSLYRLALNKIAYIFEKEDPNQIRRVREALDDLAQQEIDLEDSI